LRSLGADLPGQDHRRPHGLPFEGWYWRFTQPAAGRVVVALLGVNRDRRGAPWGTVALAGHPGGTVARAATPHAWADGLRCGAAGDGVELDAAPGHLRVRADGDALEVRLADRRGWPLRLGGSGPGHLVPGLSQYWSPHLLGARVEGVATLGGEEVVLDGALAYAEKNWGAGGFPAAWWWGQAQAFDTDPDACVAFAGGRAGLLPLRGALDVVATSVVVHAAGRTVRLVRPPLPLRIGDDGWRIGARLPAGALELELEGHGAGGVPHRLPVPLPAERANLDEGAGQHLAGELRVVLRRRGRTVLEGVSRLAGLERGVGRPPGAPRR
jgi:hypothetical protein